MTSVLNSGAVATSHPILPAPTWDGDELELQRVIDLADDAQLIADKVSVNVDVRVRKGAQVGPGQVDAVRVLCTTAPAMLGYLLRRMGLLDPPGGELDDELCRLASQGLITFEQDAAGELRCRAVEEAGDGR